MYTGTKGPTECARQKTGLIILNTQTKVQSCSKIKHTIESTTAEEWDEAEEYAVNKDTVLHMLGIKPLE